MTQPTPYSPSAEFQDIVQGPIGPALDTEFNNLNTTIDETLENLAMIQRDDGGLSNHIVTPDSLSSATLALLASRSGTATWVPRGAWTTLTAYTIGDLVSNNGNSYVAAISHTSGASFSVDLAAGKWLSLTSMLPEYEFAMGANYSKGQPVAYSNFLYIALNDITDAVTNPAADTMNWVLVGPFTPGGGGATVGVVFAADFGVVADSTPTTNGTDNAAAITSLIQWLATSPGATVIWPQDRTKVVGFTGYHQFTHCKWQKHIFGSPLRNIGSWNAGGATLLFGSSMFINHLAGSNTEINRIVPYLIDSVTEGSNSVTLKVSGEAANFYEGQWVAVLGYDQQGGGFPYNYRYIDFCRVKSISGAAITLDNPLTNAYSDDWYFYSVSGGVIGPAGIIPLDRGTGAQFCENLEVWNLEFQPNIADSPSSTLDGDNVYESGVLHIQGCYSANLHSCKSNQFWTGESETIIVNDMRVIDCEPDKCQNNLIVNRGQFTRFVQATGVDYFEINQTIIKYQLADIARRTRVNGAKFLKDDIANAPIGFGLALYQKERIYDACEFYWDQAKEIIQGGAVTEGPSAPDQPGILSLTVSNDIAPSTSQITANYNSGSSGGDGRLRLEIDKGTVLIRASDLSRAVVTAPMDYVGAGGTDPTGYFKIPISTGTTFSSGDVLYYYPIRTLEFRNPIMLGRRRMPMQNLKRNCDIYLNDRDGYQRSRLDISFRDLLPSPITNNLYELDGYLESIEVVISKAYGGVGDTRMVIEAYTPYGSTFPQQVIKTEVIGHRLILPYGSITNNSNPQSEVVFSQSLSPVAVGANTTAEQTFTVTGLATTDRLLSVVKPTAQAGLGIVGARISALNTLAITFSNNTAAPITPTAAQTYVITILRPVSSSPSGETLADFGYNRYIGLINLRTLAADNPGPSGWDGYVRVRAVRRT